jgi:L-lactate dehydrogenase complex protein LldE
MPQADECCGFGGTFSIKNAATSSAMLADKCAAIESTEAEFCTALDGSCLMQIGGGLARRGGGVRPIHLAEILAST